MVNAVRIRAWGAWRYAVIPAGLLLLLILPLTIAAGDRRQKPAAVVPETHHVFTEVPEGVEVRHDFIIYNHGTAPLEISRIDTG